MPAQITLSTDPTPTPVRHSCPAWCQLAPGHPAEDGESQRLHVRDIADFDFERPEDGEVHHVHVDVFQWETAAGFSTPAPMVDLDVAPSVGLTQTQAEDVALAMLRAAVTIGGRR